MRILSCALDEHSNIGYKLQIFTHTHLNDSFQLHWCKLQRSMNFCFAGGQELFHSTLYFPQSVHIPLSPPVPPPSLLNPSNFLSHSSLLLLAPTAITISATTAK